MGNQQVKNAPSNEEVHARYNVTADQINALETAFFLESKSKKSSSVLTVDCSTFCRVVERLREDHPELVPFDKDLAPIVFALSDSDHSNKVDPFEVIAALSIFTSGNVNEKAKLVFRVIDHDNSQTLTKQEIKKHAAKVLRLSQQLVTDDIRAKMKEQDMESVGKLAAWSMSKAMNVFEKKFSDDIVRDIFAHDTNHDGLISEQEWLDVSEKTPFCRISQKSLFLGCSIVQYAQVPD